MEERTDQPEEQGESIKIILEVALREYADENDRIKQLDGKTTPIVAATGAVLIFVAGAVARPPEAMAQFWKGLYFGGVCLALLILSAAQVFFLVTLWGRSFKRIKLAGFVTDEWMSVAPLELRRSLATKYRDLVVENAALSEQKAKAHKIGLTLLISGLGLLVMLLAISGAFAAVTQ